MTSFKITDDFPKVSSDFAHQKAPTFRLPSSFYSALLSSCADRDAAFKSLDNWLKVYERIAASALKTRPDLAKKINLAVK